MILMPGLAECRSQAGAPPARSPVVFACCRALFAEVSCLGGRSSGRRGSVTGCPWCPLPVSPLRCMPHQRRTSRDWRWQPPPPRQSDSVDQGQESGQDVQAKQDLLQEAGGL